jgi:hypothetical protein
MTYPRIIQTRPHTVRTVQQHPPDVRPAPRLLVVAQVVHGVFPAARRPLAGVLVGSIAATRCHRGVIKIDRRQGRSIRRGRLFPRAAAVPVQHALAVLVRHDHLVDDDLAGESGLGQSQRRLQKFVQTCSQNASSTTNIDKSTHQESVSSLLCCIYFSLSSFVCRSQGALGYGKRLHEVLDLPYGP